MSWPAAHMAACHLSNTAVIFLSQRQHLCESCLPPSSLLSFSTLWRIFLLAALYRAAPWDFQSVTDSTLWHVPWIKLALCSSGSSFLLVCSVSYCITCSFCQNSFPQSWLLIPFLCFPLLSLYTLWVMASFYWLLSIHQMAWDLLVSWFPLNTSLKVVGKVGSFKCGFRAVRFPTALQFLLLLFSSGVKQESLQTLQTLVGAGRNIKNTDVQVSLAL